MNTRTGRPGNLSCKPACPVLNATPRVQSRREASKTSPVSLVDTGQGPSVHVFPRKELARYPGDPQVESILREFSLQSTADGRCGCSRNHVQVNAYPEPCRCEPSWPSALACTEYLPIPFSKLVGDNIQDGPVVIGVMYWLLKQAERSRPQEVP